jgi:hypothetical protein
MVPDDVSYYGKTRKPTNCSLLSVVSWIKGFHKLKHVSIVTAAFPDLL